MLTHRTRGGCWWSGSWHWTFPSVFHYMLFCDRAAKEQPDNVWGGSTDETEVCHWILPRGKNGMHWHSLVLVEHLWGPNSGCEHREVVGGVFQQWQQRYERWAMFLTAMCSCHTTKSRDQLIQADQLMVVTVLKNSVAENSLHQMLLLCSLYLL